MGIQASSRYGLGAWASEAAYATNQINADLVADVDVTYQQFNEFSIKAVPTFFRPPRVRPSHDVDPHVLLEDHQEATIRAPITGKSGAAGTVPFWAALLLAWNFKETIDPGVDVQYDLATAAQAGFSGAKWERNLSDGNFRANQIQGGRGNASFAWEMRKEGEFNSTIMGVGYNDWTDDLAFFDAAGQPLLDLAGVALPGGYTGTATAAAKNPLICKSMGIDVGGLTYPVRSASLDLAWTTSPVESVTASQCISEWLNVRAEGAAPNGRFSLIDADAVFDDVLTKYRAATEASLFVSLTDGVDTVRFDMPKIQFGFPEGADAGGLRAWEIPYFCNGDFASSILGDNSVKVTFT